MIISASRRTDIPAFFSKWFMERIRSGYYVKVNPYNSKQKKMVSLAVEDVDVIVFWTKNPKPLMPHLKTLDELGYRYYFQFTLNDYPKALEPSVPSLKSRIQIFKDLSNLIGAEKVIWRYDPIIISNETTVNDHIERFERIAAEIGPYTKRVVISFLDMYGKVEAKLKKLREEHGLVFTDITSPDYRAELHRLMNHFATVASRYSLEMYSCAEKMDLGQYGVQHGACIDIKLIQKIFGSELRFKKDPYQRSECLCAESEDMGVYDTCKFNCTYCYAVRSEKTVNKHWEKHDVHSPLLIGQLDNEEVDCSLQLKLFDD
ncbi:uncharacterized protein DUF1848 [Thermolongibacillus altinsuensis]|uniref:Uncharacterized protein DUF1848 n=1 Tax=Thermolongibacillus altinsuensis TaxID=575256 RepID=A0A4V2QA58_9BACL|nr:DUF1848 domain-containing protein [Thermolongibacillus altinsuensis]TCL48446.1 uncharacterized protein DUF1848 [Thermolongibacillus altinsuensis]